MLIIYGRTDEKEKGERERKGFKENKIEIKIEKLMGGQR